MAVAVPGAGRSYNELTPNGSPAPGADPTWSGSAAPDPAMDLRPSPRPNCRRLRGVRMAVTGIYVPDDVDRNLTENFGAGWRVSDPGYSSHLESPSTVDVGGPVYQLVGRQNCLMAIQRSKPDKLLRALDLLERVQDMPGGMKPDLMEGLRRLGRDFPQDPVASKPEQAEAAA